MSEMFFPVLRNFCKITIQPTTTTKHHSGITDFVVIGFGEVEYQHGKNISLSVLSVGMVKVKEYCIYCEYNLTVLG